MLVTAPDTRSVAYRRRNFNPRRPEKSQVRARCAWRDAVDANPKYSPGAKTALRRMDYWAGWGGLAYPKHGTLAKEMGRSRQSVQRYIAELERGGEIIRVERAGRAVRYVLRWAAEGHRRASALVNNPVCMQPECAPRTEPEQPAPVEVAESRAGTPEPEGAREGGKGPERECPHCRGTFYRTVVEYFRVGKVRHVQEKRVICRCGQ